MSEPVPAVEPCGPWFQAFAILPHFTHDGGVVWLRHGWKRHLLHHLPPLPPLEDDYGDDDGYGYSWEWRRFAPNPAEIMHDPMRGADLDAAYQRNETDVR